MRLLILTADPHTLLCHRRDLLADLAAQGWRITAAASGPGGPAEEYLQSLGGEYRQIRMTRSGLSPLGDLQTLADMNRLMKEVQPDAVFAYTIKSVAYGCLAAWHRGVGGIFPLICGLGYAFAPDGTLRQRLVSAVSERLYRAALKRASCVFLQNHDDAALLLERGILRENIPHVVVPGSGVNLEQFRPAGPDMAAAESGTVRFVLVSRLLRSKGILHYVEAARRLRAEHPAWEFHIAGAPDPGADGIPESEARAWNQEGAVQWHGVLSDVRPLLAQAHAFVLPTWYREGVPKSTLEALAMGLPVITTDSTGSRETVRLTESGRAARAAGASVMEGENGCLITPQSTESLECAMRTFGENPSAMPALAAASRHLAETVFDVRLVNKAMIQQIRLPGTMPGGILQPAGA